MSISCLFKCVTWTNLQNLDWMLCLGRLPCLSRKRLCQIDRRGKKAVSQSRDGTKNARRTFCVGSVAAYIELQGEVALWMVPAWRLCMWMGQMRSSLQCLLAVPVINITHIQPDITGHFGFGVTQERQSTFECFVLFCGSRTRIPLGGHHEPLKSWVPLKSL